MFKWGQVLNSFGKKLIEFADQLEIDENILKDPTYMQEIFRDILNENNLMGLLRNMNIRLNHDFVVKLVPHHPIIYFKDQEMIEMDLPSEEHEETNGISEPVIEDEHKEFEYMESEQVIEDINTDIIENNEVLMEDELPEEMKRNFILGALAENSGGLTSEQIAVYIGLTEGLIMPVIQTLVGQGIISFSRDSKKYKKV